MYMGYGLLYYPEVTSSTLAVDTVSTKDKPVKTLHPGSKQDVCMHVQEHIKSLSVWFNVLLTCMSYFNCTEMFSVRLLSSLHVLPNPCSTQYRHFHTHIP